MPTLTKTVNSKTKSRASWWKILLTWSKQELLLLMREPVAVFFSLIFPIVMYVFIGIPYGNEEVGEGIKYIDVMFPALILTVASNLLLMGLPIYLAELRSRGADRRYAILPLPSWIFVSAVLSAMLVLLVCASAIIVMIVGIRDGFLPTAGSFPFIAMILGTVAWLSALGFFIGSLRLSPRTIQALGAVCFFIMFFGSGAAIPIDKLPQIFQDILAWNPLKQWLDVTVAYYTDVPISTDKLLRLLVAVPITLVCVFAGLSLRRREH